MLTESFKVRYAEIGYNNQLPVWVLQNYAQQAAALDAHNFSAGWEELSAKGVAWVLIKMQFKITGAVTDSQTVNVKTWHVISDKIRSRRDFIFYDERGNEIASAVSWWIVIDLETRKIMRTPPKVLENNGKDTSMLAEIEVKEPDFKTLTPIKTVCMVSRLEDIDVNGHVNNTHFTAWALEGVPQAVREAKLLSEIVIDFKAEVLADQKIKVETYEVSESSFWHVLTRESDNKKIATAYTVWK